MSIKNFSTTPASNQSGSVPEFCPEGWALSSINAWGASLMADVRSFAAADTIASASTTDIGSKDNAFLTLTGAATTITSLGTVSAGIFKFVIYNAAHTVTHNATSLILLSGANRTVAAGSASLFVAEATGWRELFYSPYGASAYQPLDDQLTTLAGITAQQATDIASVSTFVGTLLDDADATAAKTTLGVSDVPVRQTVLGGPVDSSGYPSFLPATSGSLAITSQNVTSGAPFVAASANGFGSTGAVDRVGQSTVNITWSGLTANSTNYLYIDIAADGSMTPGSTTLAPNYQFGGTRSTTNNQATFNIQEMSMTVGNGSTAPQAYRVFVGEADTNTSTVTAARAYAYQGRYVSADTALQGAGVTTNFSHNIGTTLINADCKMVCLVADQGWNVGEIAPLISFTSNAYVSGAVPWKITSRTDIGTLAGSFSGWMMMNGSGNYVGVTLANWKQRISVQRGW